jgi:hypothetical protein
VKWYDSLRERERKSLRGVRGELDEGRKEREGEWMGNLRLEIGQRKE